MMTAGFNYNNLICCRSKRGAALLIVLMIVMAITIVSLAFISKSSVQLECGDNMLLYTQMDYLAESALEYAKEQILLPQNAAGQYWAGGQGLQLDDLSNYFFDVNILRTANCNYALTAESYLIEGGQKIAQSKRTANLRLDPAIAYWQVKNAPISPETTVNGDIYCVDNLINYGKINGDAYTTKAVTNFSPGNIAGRKYQNISAASLVPPVLDINDFKTQYYIGDSLYSAGQLTNNIYNNIVLGPTETNPAGIYYRDGDIEVNNITITGTLVVKHDMKIMGSNTTITAVKNFPALLVGHNLTYEATGAKLNVIGLVNVWSQIDFKSKSNCRLNINGALVIASESIKNTTGSLIEITAFPDKASLQLWPTRGTSQRWSPASGAVFQQIRRNEL
jgi:hypothetical protein